MRFTNKSKNTYKIKNDGDIYQESKKWFEKVPEYPNKFQASTEQVVSELREEAKICLDSETANYNIKNSKQNSSLQWMKTVMTKGTMSDRIASHTVTIQDDPIHNLDILRNFVSMVKVAKKKDGINVIDTLTELFLEDLLIPNRKLGSFHQKPLSLLNELSSGNAVTRRKILSAWYFEDQLKEIYGMFIESLYSASRDSVDSNKEKAIAAMYKLLAGNPEQEEKLLALIVNKLGDPSQKVASKAIYCLGQLLRTHSNMQMVVLGEVEKLLFRPNVSTKSQYYSLCFLSQFYLSHDESEMAKRLIEVYFSFFKACIKKGDIDSRMMSALLIGVNRAFPYAKLDIEKISKDLDTIYRVVHLANSNVSLHALNLLYQVSDSTNDLSNRFFSALYKKLLDPQLSTTPRQAMLLNLVYKSLLKDTEINRVKAIVKRLLQLCLNSTPSFACGVLYLISQLLRKRKEILALVQKKATFTEVDDEEIYEDEKLEPDVDAKEEKSLITEDSEKVNDAVGSQEIESESREEQTEVKPDVENIPKSWYHWNINSDKIKKCTNTYNPFVRNPLFSGAEHTAFSELDILRQHFHPTVSLYATNILNGDTIKYQGDPIEDFTLIKFLERFVFKNPKTPDSLKKGAHPMFGQRKYYQAKGVKSLGVTSYNYIHTPAENIPVDEKFLYQYLNKKYANRKIKDGDDDDDDIESVASDEFEDMLEKMGGINEDLDENDDLDFSSDIGNNLKKKDKRKNEELMEDIEEDDDEEDLDEDEGDLDEEYNEEDLSLNESESEDEKTLKKLKKNDDAELMDDLDEDDDAEDLVFDESESEEEKSPKKFEKDKKRINSIFASADEFATLLEDEGSSKRKPGSSNSFRQKDNADLKQINWEEMRNRWVSGYNKAIGKKSKKYNFKSSKGSKSKNFRIEKRKSRK